MTESLAIDFPIPSYNSSLDAPVPSYTESPSSGEQCLLSVSRAGHRDEPPRGKAERPSKHFSVSLDGQFSSSREPCDPTYGLNSVISGSIKLTKPHDVAEVKVKFVGKLETAISENGSESLSLVKESYSLWSNKDPGASSAPSTVDFAIPFPSEFDEAGVGKPMPPSMDVSIFSPPPLFARVAYHLHIQVVHVPKLGGIWNKCSRMTIKLMYTPRSRPFRPILPNPDLLSTVKFAPNEWFQTIHELELKKPSTHLVPPVLHVFIPSSKIFALSEPIPFHLQMSGSQTLLSEFLPPSYEETSSSSNIRRSSSSRRSGGSQNATTKLRVQLLRQCVVHVRCTKAFKNLPAGEGELFASTHTYHDGGNILQLDWVGHLLPCKKEVTYGGFNVGHLAIKDFLTVDIIPSLGSSFKQDKVAVSIRLVTDPWVDGVSPADHRSLERSRVQPRP